MVRKDVFLISLFSFNFVSAIDFNHMPDAREIPHLVALIDGSTVTIHAGWGKAFTDRFDSRVKFFNSHFNREGGEVVTDLIIKELEGQVKDLTAFLKRL